MTARLIVCFVLVSFGLSAQWKATTLEEFSKAIMASESLIADKGSYSFETSYLFFDSAEGSVTSLSFGGGITCEKGSEIAIDQFNRWTVQDGSVNVTCDTAQRVVILKKADPALFQRKTAESYAPFLNGSFSVAKQQQGKRTGYLVTFPPGGQYKSAEIWFSEKGLVERYVLLSAQPIIDETRPGEDKTIEPRMEITYSNYVFGNSVATQKMRRVKDFVSQSGTNYTLAPAYQGFELIDLR